MTQRGELACGTGACGTGASEPVVEGIWRLGPLGLAPASRWPRIPFWAFGLVAAWVVLEGLAALLAPVVGSEGPPCLFRWVTQVPCPTCGTGRGARALLGGDLWAAFTWNPLFFGLLSLGAGLMLLRVVGARKVVLLDRDPQSRDPRRTRRLWLAGGALFVANWIFLLIAGR